MRTENVTIDYKNLICEVPLSLISSSIAEYYGIDEEFIFHRCRELDVLKIRYTFFALAKEFNGGSLSYAYIGSFCDRRFGLKAFDHSTVINALNQHYNMMATIPDYKSHYTAIKNEVVELSEIIKDKRSELAGVKAKLVTEITEAQGYPDLIELLVRNYVILKNKVVEINENS